MRLMVQSFNIGSSWNKEEEETNLRTYTLNHMFNKPAECNIVLADVDGSMLRKYKTDTKVELEGGVADDGGVETDETTEANSAAANDMTLCPAVPVNNDAFYYGFSDQAGAMTINVGTAQVVGGGGGAVTITWEYSQGSDVWAALAGVTDGTDNYENSGENDVEWTIPGDWDTDEVGSIADTYWVRARLTVVGAGPGTVPIGTQAWYNRVWLGPGKITLEDPNNTDVFFGRIVNAVGGTDHPRTLTLECRDWLDQLDEEKITYDMREKLGTTNLRQSMGRSDVDGDRLVAENAGGGVFNFWDDGDYDDDGGMAFVNDAYNGMFLIFTAGMAGTKTWRFHPYDSDDNADDYTDAVDRLWVNDDSVDVASANNDFEIDYDFHIELGHNTPSDFYVHDSISGARVIVVENFDVLLGGGNHAHIQIDDKTDGWIDLHRLEESHHYSYHTFDISVDNIDDIVDANGIATVRFDVDFTGGLASIGVRFLAIEVDVATTGYSSPIGIDDTVNPNKLVVDTDLTAAATQIWEGIPYCIAQNIYKHIDTAEGGTIISDGDTIVTLTAAATIEHTSGISTRQYKNRTRLQILQDLARQDKSSFWIALGTTTVTSKQTFGANTETMTDATPDNWHSRRDYKTLVNSVDVYGARIGDYEIYQQSQDADSLATYKATRSQVIKNAGLVSDADASALGTALAARDSNIEQMVACTLSGFDTTYRLGTIVEITSSYLWATAAKDYIVSRWAYDSDARKTHLTLHPKVSIGLQDIDTLLNQSDKLKRATLESESDKVVPDPITHEVS